MNPELSEPWDQAQPRLASVALNDLDALRGECTDEQRKARARFFVKARNLIERIRDENGWHVKDSGDLVKSFPPRNRADEQGRRVDVEVKAGSAFVPDPDPQGAS